MPKNTRKITFEEYVTSVLNKELKKETRCKMCGEYKEKFFDEIILGFVVPFFGWFILLALWMGYKYGGKT